MKRKIIALCLIVAMLGVAVVGSTLAYFTDTAEASNVFTVGKIDIDLIEEVDVLNADKTKSLAADKLTYDENGATYTNIMPTNYLKKEVTIQNNDAPAYVRVVVMLNNVKELWNAVDETYEPIYKAEYMENNPGATNEEAAAYAEEMVQKNYYDKIFADWGYQYRKSVTVNGETVTSGMRGWMLDTAIDDRLVDAKSKGTAPYVFAIDAVRRTTTDLLFDLNNAFKSDKEQNSAGGSYKNTVNPGNSYYSPLLVNEYELMFAYYIYLDEGDSVTLFEGLNVPAEFDNEQMSFFENLKIEVYADAIQAESFEDDAKAAFDALNAAHSLASLRGREQNGAIVGAGTIVDNVDDLKDALQNGDNVSIGQDMPELPDDESNAYGSTALSQHNGGIIDGLDNAIAAPLANGTWDTVICTTGGTIRNLTISKGFRGIFVNHDSTHTEPLILENVTIDGTTYTISCDQGTNRGLTATGCTINGWTSYAATIGDVKFIDTYFGYGAGYSFCRPYAPTAFVGCEFEAGYEIDPRAAVTFENCTIAGEPLTAANLATLVTSNIANATVIG